MSAANQLTPKGLNQPPPFSNVNLWETDLVLRDAVIREGADWAGQSLARLGRTAGSSKACRLAREANLHIPELAEGDDGEVVFHQAYHELMTISMKHGLHCSTWDHMVTDGKQVQGLHVARAAGFYMAAQMEAGHCCPVTMTHAAVAAMKAEPDMLDSWLPKILSRDYDPSFKPVSEKRSATIGMGMTEIQGGTDVRTNLTQATPVRDDGSGRIYETTGHKYFMSAPMSDAFLVLAQAPGGLTCFLMPRFRPDGSLNSIRIRKLKDKLGNRSNASCEAEFDGAYAVRIAEEGRGIPAIIEMVTLTRLDCAISSAGLMRSGLANAIHHCRHRTVFQKRLTDHPLMLNVLADLALHVEAATLFAIRVARAFDNPGDEKEAAWSRLMTPVAKYWICKTAPAFAYEAMECLGGIGYIEDMGPLARLYREVPVNAIWEGSGNVMCLDVLRVLQREPEAISLVLEDLSGMANGEAALKAHISRIEECLSNTSQLEQDARVLTGLLAELAAGALMRAHAPSAIADAYIAARFTGASGRLYGEIKPVARARDILERALPAG